MQQLQPNTLLQGGKYRIVRFLSSGGFGNTYEGVHTMMDTRVAIKEFFPKMFCDRDENSSHVTVATQGNRELVDKLRKKFNEEAKAVFKMKHDNIVRVLDIFEENGTAYYVMEYIDGKSLNDIINEQVTLPESEAVAYIHQVADALKYVHSLNRLHLDIKPGNIMVDKNGKAILIDFGASKHYDMESGENTSTLLGLNTKGYAPIEQCTQSFTSFSPATDIYALGATLYKLLTGVTPPDSNILLAKEDTLQPLPSFISGSTRNAVMSAMKLIRTDRLQNVDDFMSLLCQKVDDEDTIVDSDDGMSNRADTQNDECHSDDDVDNVTWWDEEGMVPVATWNFHGKEGQPSIFTIALCLTSMIVASILLVSFIMSAFNYGRSEDSVGTIVLYIIVYLIIIYLLLSNIFPRIIIKLRKELKPTDYIVTYNTRKVRYVIVARGNSCNHKFGLFDVKKLRLIVPFKYDDIVWFDDKILKVKYGQDSYTMDIKGHVFK